MHEFYKGDYALHQHAHLRAAGGFIYGRRAIASNKFTPDRSLATEAAPIDLATRDISLSTGPEGMQPWQSFHYSEELYEKRRFGWTKISKARDLWFRDHLSNFSSPTSALVRRPSLSAPIGSDLISF
jgi:hypothetical protein